MLLNASSLRNLKGANHSIILENWTSMGVSYMFRFECIYYRRWAIPGLAKDIILNLLFWSLQLFKGINFVHCSSLQFTNALADSANTSTAASL